MSAAVHLVMPFAHSLRQLEDWGKPEILETNAVMKMAWLLYLEIPGNKKLKRGGLYG